MDLPYMDFWILKCLFWTFSPIKSYTDVSTWGCSDTTDEPLRRFFGPHCVLAPGHAWIPPPGVAPISSALRSCGQLCACWQVCALEERADEHQQRNTHMYPSLSGRGGDCSFALICISVFMLGRARTSCVRFRDEEVTLFTLFLMSLTFSPPLFFISFFQKQQWVLYFIIASVKVFYHNRICCGVHYMVYRARGNAAINLFFAAFKMVFHRFW